MVKFAISKPSVELIEGNCIEVGILSKNINVNINFLIYFIIISFLLFICFSHLYLIALNVSAIMTVQLHSAHRAVIIIVYVTFVGHPTLVTPDSAVWRKS